MSRPLQPGLCTSSARDITLGPSLVETGQVLAHMELWYTERHTRGAGITLRVKQTLFVGRSSCQSIEVLDTEDYGRVLLLDGLIMTTDRDEFLYHEMIAHPSLCVHPRPERVLVIGGGDGGTVREVLRHPDVKRVVLCEIDPMVVDVAKEFFPSLAGGLGGNDRVEVLFQDGIRYLRDRRGEWDVVIVDSTDPIGPAAGLFEKGFYCNCFDALRPDGILVAQSESPIYHLELQARMKGALVEAGFPHVCFYTGPVPSYPGGFWSWVVASRRYHPVRDLQPHRAERLEPGLRCYHRGLHAAAFALPAFMQQALERDDAGRTPPPLGKTSDRA